MRQRPAPATRRLMHARARRNDKMRAVHATIRLAEDVTGTGMAPIPDLLLRHCSRLSFCTSCTFASFAALRLSHDHHSLACAPRRKGIGRSPNVRLPDDLDIILRTGILRVGRHRRWIAKGHKLD